MSDKLYIKLDKEKTYSVNSEEELKYYNTFRPKIGTYHVLLIMFMQYLF